ncbi:XLF-domain-containing protein [Ascodesmis nigricans]|uniref:Non-homologous end-joining factor 1 n=1 Tax=Ascodesmis nigricans TaxID=341454 RepID=A0A4S2MHJ6_9PEZI|nr:XLF-domain-containing protein [Ascodesmis nigricans]
MSNRRAPIWQPLRLTNPIRSAPPLLALGSFNASSYDLQLTDLTQVWYEKLSRAQILQRAAVENTSIDPSEAPANLTKLLEYLQQAIASALPDIETDLFTTGGRHAGGADLRLKIKCPLPDGLEELTWTFELQHGTPVDFTNMFVLPMLSRENLLADRVDSLLDKVGEKDAVIERLVDHLEDQKMDPRLVVGHRRKKILEKFNKEDWEEEVRGIGEIRPMKVVEQVFGDGRDINAPLVRPFGEDADKWWTRLDDTPSIHSAMSQFRSTSRSFSGPAAPQTPGVEKHGEETDADEDLDMFTVRMSPPRGHETVKPPKQRTLHRELSPTVDIKMQDDNLDAVTTPQPKPAPSAVSGKRRIGKIGGKVMGSPTWGPPSASPQAPPPQPCIDLTMNDPGEETASEPESALPPPTKPRLGTIGGRRPIGRIGGINNTSMEGESTPVPTTGGRSPTKAGLDISFGTLSPPRPPARFVAIKRSISPVKPKEPSPDMDPDERADLRRKQIAQELEAKRKSLAKKKRKF